MPRNRVTFAIAYANVSHLKPKIRELTQKIKRLRLEGKKISAARLAIDCAELLIQYADEPDSGLSEEEEEEHRENNLNRALSHCKAGYNVLIELDKPYHDTIKALEYMTDAYRRLKNYDEAIQSNKTLIHRLREMKDDLELRNAIRTLGDIYFERGHEPDLAKYNDFENARIYYLQERNILDQLDPDTEGYMAMKVSLDFNLGVIEAKFVEGLERGEQYLVKAIKGAHQLGDHEQERRAYWELGNICKRNDDLKSALRCQIKELQLIEKHSNTDEKIPCLIEIELVDSEDDENEATSSTKLVVAIKTRIEFEHFMYKVALASAEKGIQCIDQDLSIQKQLPRLRIALLQLRAELAWRLREMSVDQLIAFNDELISEINTYFIDSSQRLNQLQIVHERVTKIYYYFERKDDYHQQSQVLKESGHLDYWSAESYDYAVDTKEIPRIMLSNSSTSLMDITVMVPVDGENKGILVPIDKDIRTIGWLTSKVTELAWEQFGVEPCVNRLQVGSRSLSPHEIVLSISQDTAIEAVVDGYVKKTPIEIYQNACVRLGLPALAIVENTLRDHHGGGFLNLSGAGLSSRDVAVITQVLKRIPPLNTLDLSANLFCTCLKIPHTNHYPMQLNVHYQRSDDQDIVEILTSTPGIQHLDLKSNRLTHNIITLLDCRSLLSLDLSFNPLGPESLAKLPQGLENWPSIKRIKLIYCDVGGYFRITDEVQASYDNAAFECSIDGC
ncbi:hypothetical protein K492DRAFT_184930 [Lichtheimia hyalospora FSU 10163]|nr:hypothetical protein K492DRAFT_184930 [Lichtheimia hyalospora FSU 10163]